MNEKNIQLGKNFRTIGKYRFIFLLGIFWSSTTIVLDVLIEAFPEGVFIKFKPFLFDTLYHLIGGFFFGLFLWYCQEAFYERRKKHLIYLFIGFVLLIIIITFVFKMVEFTV